MYNFSLNSSERQSKKAATEPNSDKAPKTFDEKRLNKGWVPNHKECPKIINGSNDPEIKRKLKKWVQIFENWENILYVKSATPGGLFYVLKSRILHFSSSNLPLLVAKGFTPMADVVFEDLRAYGGEELNSVHPMVPNLTMCDVR